MTFNFFYPFKNRQRDIRKGTFHIATKLKYTPHWHSTVLRLSRTLTMRETRVRFLFRASKLVIFLSSLSGNHLQQPEEERRLWVSVVYHYFFHLYLKQFPCLVLCLMFTLQGRQLKRDPFWNKLVKEIRSVPNYGTRILFSFIPSGREFGTTGEKSNPRPFFLKSRELFGGGPKSQLSNSNPLVLKGLSRNLFLMYGKPSGLRNLMAQNVGVAKI